MLGQRLPDGRVPVVLSSHDESLIAADADAILHFLDRLDGDHDPTADVASTVVRLRRAEATEGRKSAATSAKETARPAGSSLSWARTSRASGASSTTARASAGTARTGPRPRGDSTMPPSRSRAAKANRSANGSSASRAEAGRSST